MVWRPSRPTAATTTIRRRCCSIAEGHPGRELISKPAIKQRPTGCARASRCSRCRAERCAARCQGPALLESGLGIVGFQRATCQALGADVHADLCAGAVWRRASRLFSRCRADWPHSGRCRAACRASVPRSRFVPDLPRSVESGLVAELPSGLDGGTVQACSAPVDRAGRLQAFQHHLIQGRPDSAPAGRAAAASNSSGNRIAPRPRMEKACSAQKVKPASTI